MKMLATVLCVLTVFSANVFAGDDQPGVDPGRAIAQQVLDKNFIDSNEMPQLQDAVDQAGTTFKTECNAQGECEIEILTPDDKSTDMPEESWFRLFVTIKNGEVVTAAFFLIAG